jgi:hypothetical protein
MILSSSFRYRSLVSDLTLESLHYSFVELAPASKIGTSASGYTAGDSLTIILSLLINTDPSPDLISFLLTPILPHLYSLSSHLRNKKTADPAVRNSLEGTLVTWGRLVDQSEGLAALWLIIQGEYIDWDSDIAGNFRRTKRFVLCCCQSTTLSNGKEGLIQMCLSHSSHLQS